MKGYFNADGVLIITPDDEAESRSLVAVLDGLECDIMILPVGQTSCDCGDAEHNHNLH